MATPTGISGGAGPKKRFLGELSFQQLAVAIQDRTSGRSLTDLLQLRQICNAIPQGNLGVCHHILLNKEMLDTGRHCLLDNRFYVQDAFAG
jgi:hypothetical protein